MRLFELGIRALRHMELPRRAEPHLHSLTERTGETSTLAVLDHFEALYVGRAESSRMLRASSIGSGPRFFTYAARSCPSRYCRTR